MTKTATIRCYFCGVDQETVSVDESSDLVLVDDRLWTFDPCTKCVDDMRFGIILIETVEGDMGDNPERTGRRLVVPEEFVRELFNPVMISAAMQTRLVFVMQNAFAILENMWEESKN